LIAGLRRASKRWLPWCFPCGRHHSSAIQAVTLEIVFIYIEDIFYTFQLKYPKTIFSRFTALYFYNLTEIYPSTFDITVNENYHTEDLNVNHNVVKCKKDNLNLGLTQIITSLGNKINIYDRERCICDIIRFKNRLDLEQVKKSVKMYVKDNNKDLNKLSEYSKKLNIYNEVMEFIGMYYE